MDEQTALELQTLCKPLIEFMKKQCNPYDHIVISADSIKIANETLSIPIGADFN